MFRNSGSEEYQRQVIKAHTTSMSVSFRARMKMEVIWTQYSIYLNRSSRTVNISSARKPNFSN